MARDVWKTPGGKAEATAESAKGVAAFQRQRDQRKAEAIALHDRGLDAKEIAKELGISRRTVNRYLLDHLTLSRNLYRRAYG